MLDILDKLPLLPVTVVGDIALARDQKSLDMVLVLRSRTGPFTQVMSDEVAMRLGIELIRESGRRSERTQQIINTLYGALAAQAKETSHEQAEHVSVRPGSGDAALPDGGNGAAQQDRPPVEDAGVEGDPVVGGRRQFSPATPRSLRLRGTEAAGGHEGSSGAGQGGDQSG